MALSDYRNDAILFLFLDLAQCLLNGAIIYVGVRIIKSNVIGVIEVGEYAELAETANACQEDELLKVISEKYF